MVKKILTFCAIGLISLSTVKAQSLTQKWAVGFHVGVEQYKGELGSGFFKFGQDLNGFVGLDVSRYLTPHFDVVFHSTYGDMSYINGTDPVIFTRQNMFQANFNGRYNILTDDYKLRPYVFVGFGHMRFADGNYSQANTIIPYGLGLTYQVKPNIALRLQETFIYSDFDRMDGDNSVKLNDSYLQHSISLVFNLGNGIVDTDQDGVADEDDACPQTKGSKAANGCPDADGDGIPDAEDKCPHLAGVAENDGCPEVKESDRQILKDALHGVNFKTGSDVIEESSFTILDNVVNLMKLNSMFNLEINGHTDSQGNDDLNLNLSQKRANSVKAYLVSKGIEESRLTAKGFGETQPIADNGTAEGRAENRRVELKIKFNK